MFSEVVTLLKEIESIDAYGDTVRSYEEKEIFARVDRIYLGETIIGMSHGLKPEYRFTITDYLDYDEQKEVMYNGKKYKIINVQRKGIELEINCIGGHSG